MSVPNPDFSNRPLPSRRLSQADQLEKARLESRRAARRRRSQASRRTVTSASVTPASVTPTPVNPQVVRSLPKSQAPLWLNLLLKVQNASSLVTTLLVIAVLAVYGWTVYVQQQWGKEYRQMESYKKHERQMVATNEVLKNQMAEQAENPTLGLMLPDPANTIYLTPAPNRPAATPKPTSTPDSAPIPTKPLGY